MNETETTQLKNPAIVAEPAKRRRAPSIKRATSKLQKEQSRGFPLPLILTCPVTNKVNKYTSLAYIRKLIAKYGSVEELRKSYVSADGRKQQVVN